MQLRTYTNVSPLHENFRQLHPLSSVLDHLYQTLVQHFLKEVPQERDVNKDAEVMFCFLTKLLFYQFTCGPINSYKKQLGRTESQEAELLLIPSNWKKILNHKNIQMLFVVYPVCWSCMTSTFKAINIWQPYHSLQEAISMKLRGTFKDIMEQQK